MLARKLKEKQRQLGLSDRKFAERLSVPRSTWQLTKTGIKPVRRRIALAAMRVFPDLTTDALSFLLSDAASATDQATHANDYEASQGA